MNYHIKPQGDSWLVLQANPENPKDGHVDRLIAVCGNRSDAAQVVAGLRLLRYPAGLPDVFGIGQH